MANQDSLMILGNDKIKDFGGKTEKLNFTDYKQAFTDSSMLIDTSTVDISGRSKSLKQIETQRDKISFNMNSEEQKLYALQQMEQQKSEENRIKRLQLYDMQHQEAHQKINSILLR